MGQFSWICSDTEKALLCYDIYKENISKYTKRAFLLIPEEFGGGSFKVDNNYEGYGVFYDERGKEHDVYVEFSNEYIKYPIKIVEIECPYREAKVSESDPNQGWGEDEDEGEYE